MRTALQRVFPCFLVALVTVACSNPGAELDSAASAPPPDPNARPRGAPPAGHEWIEVWEKVAKCAASKCSGASGFGVTAKGHYYVGSSEPSSSARGLVTLTEQEILSKAAIAAAVQEFTGSARCFDSDPAPGAATELSLRVLRGGSTDPVALYETTNGGKRTCVRGDQSVAQALRDAMAPLIAKYDPVPTATPTPSGSPAPRPSIPFPWPFP